MVTPGAPPMCPHSPEAVTPTGVVGIEWVSGVDVPLDVLINL